MGFRNKKSCKNWPDCDNYVYGDFAVYCDECKRLGRDR